VRRPRPLWNTVHRWLGIGLGLWFMLVGLTGALLVYRDALDRWLNPTLLTPRTHGPALPIAEVVDLAALSLGLGRVEKIHAPAGSDDVYRLQVRPLASRVGASRLEAFIDPASGGLLGTRSLDAISLAPPHLLRTLYEFHRNVLLGNWGSNIVGVAGMLLLVSVVSGLTISWPRRARAWQRLVWVNTRASATRIVFDLHRSSGVLIGVLLLLSTLTGATLVYLNYVRDLVGLFSRVESFPTIPWRAANEPESLALGDVVQRVNAAFPAHRIVELHLPPRGASGLLFYLRASGDAHHLGDTILWLHPSTGEILSERSARTRSSGEAFMHWLFPLHTGSAFGGGGLVAMCLAGTLPLLLVTSGLWVWLRKRRGERIARQRQLERKRAS
jgi:uncharacterized iron-regulated membrane protein